MLKPNYPIAFGFIVSFIVVGFIQMNMPVYSQFGIIYILTPIKYCRRFCLYLRNGVLIWHLYRRNSCWHRVSDPPVCHIPFSNIESQLRQNKRETRSDIKRGPYLSK